MYTKKRTLETETINKKRITRERQNDSLPSTRSGSDSVSLLGPVAHDYLLAPSTAKGHEILVPVSTIAALWRVSVERGR